MPIVAEERLELVEIEFQVWCATCRKGICNSVDEDIRRNERLGGKHFTVSCPHCEKEKEELEKERDTLEDTVKQLTEEVTRLEHEVDNLQGQLNELQ